MENLKEKFSDENFKNRVVIASGSEDRDGIGIEVYQNDELIVEIFRDDEHQTRTMTLFQENVSLELVEKSIAIFKKEIPWDFI